MNGPATHNAIKRFLWRLLVALAALTLLLPTAGPLADHHLAERQPNHAHIYLGPAVPDHAHPFESPHAHSHDHPAASTGDAFPDDRPSSGIVYLTSYDGMSHAFAELALPTIEAPFIFPDPEDNRRAYGSGEDNAFIRDSLIAPPWRPPVA